MRRFAVLITLIVLGACSTVDTNNRWPDHIAERLQAEGHPDVAVVNEAYSGDRVLTNGMGTNALSRFDISVPASCTSQTSCRD